MAIRGGPFADRAVELPAIHQRFARAPSEDEHSEELQEFDEAEHRVQSGASGRNEKRLPVLFTLIAVSVVGTLQVRRSSSVRVRRAKKKVLQVIAKWDANVGHGSFGRNLA